MSYQYKSNSRGLFFPFLIFFIVVTVGLALLSDPASATEISFVKIGRFWTVATDNGGRPEASIAAGWWPNDFNTIGNSASSGVSVAGNNITLMCDWRLVYFPLNDN
jgi:hypothetical protein